jgi:hypothetical protein
MRNQNNNGYFSVHRTMLSNGRFEDATEIGLWVTFASEFAYEECEVKGKFTGKPIKLKPNQQVFSTDQLGQLLNGVWTGTKSGKKRLTRHMVNLRMNKWKAIGLIDWIDCDCRTDGRLFTIKMCRPNLGETEAVSETKPAAPNIKKNSSSSSSGKTKADGVTKEEVDRVAKAMADIFVLPSELDTPEVREAWGDFIVNRMQLDPKSKGMTERAAKVITNRLLKAKVTLDEVVCAINVAIESGWKNVFPKKLEVKVVKRTGKSTHAPSGLEALIASDTAATKLEEKVA